MPIDDAQGEIFMGTTWSSSAEPPRHCVEDRPRNTEIRFLPGTVLAGRYRVVHLLGHGAMGEVYRADDLELGQQVALKFLPESVEGDPHRLDLLRGEVRLARRVAHPNICRVYDLGSTGGHPFLSMEYIDGEDLAGLFRRLGRLPREKAMEISHELCLGIAAVHAEGIVHRDLKPSNLMIDGFGCTRVTDFGLAGLAGSVAVGGTPAYMAPEQRRGAEASAEGDVYAVGLIVWELLSGLSPADRKGRQPSVEEFGTTLGELVLRCLEDDPARRPAARELAEVLARDAPSAWRPEPGLTPPGRPHWQLERRLGEGGFGEVWLATREKTGERRVFKLCTDPAKTSALHREINLYRLLYRELGERDDIIRILDWNLDQPPFFLESEYTAGGDLLEWAERRGGLLAIPLGERLEVVARVAETLADAHTVGVLHQDVKPTNILVAEDEDGGVRPRLADFGIGAVTEERRFVEAGITVLDATRTMVVSRAGTRLYMAPELLEGRPASARSDVYALGVLLYQMVVGDFSRALAPGWDRDVEDEFLVEDITLAVDGSPERRLANAAELAERLRGLEERKAEFENKRREREEMAQAKAALAQVRRRRKLILAASSLLVFFLVALAVMFYNVIHQAERANSEAAAAEEVAGFLMELFKVSDPELGQSGQITAREILERGAVRIDSELAGQPQVRAKVMQVIGGVYFNLGLYDEAAGLFERALGVRQELYGEEHLEVAESLDTLANVLRLKEDLDRAEDLTRKVLTMRRKLLGDEDPRVAESLEALGSVLRLRGRYDDARALFEEALEMRRRLFQGDSLDVAQSMVSLADLLMEMGLFNETGSFYREALGIRQRLLGNDHPKVAETLDGMALFSFMHGDYDTAELHYREALTMRQRLFDDDHLDIAASLNQLALLYRTKGNYEQAEALFLETLDILEEKLGVDHTYVAGVTSHLALSHYLQHDYKESEEFYKKSLTIYRRQLGEDHVHVAGSMRMLSLVVEAQGRVEEAEELLLKSWSILRNQQNLDSPIMRETLHFLVNFYERQGRPDEAEKYRALLP